MSDKNVESVEGSADVEYKKWIKELIKEEYIYARYHALEMSMNRTKVMDTIETLLREVVLHRPENVEEFWIDLINNISQDSYYTKKEEIDKQDPFFLISTHPLFRHLNEKKQKLLVASLIRREVEEGEVLNPTSGYIILEGGIKVNYMGKECEYDKGFVNMDCLPKLNNEWAVELNSVKTQKEKDDLTVLPELKTISKSILLELTRDSYQYLCINNIRVPETSSIELVRKQSFFDSFEEIEKETIVKCMKMKTFSCGENMADILNDNTLIMLGDGVATYSKEEQSSILFPPAIISNENKGNLVAGNKEKMENIMSNEDEIGNSSYCVVYILDLEGLSKLFGRNRMKLLRSRIKSYTI